jgi:glycosyltransferase involved in cell wall biosynthesis
MGPDAMVSVIIPVFRGMETLGACLHALDAQSYPSYEVIVVDNGGNPGIAELCQTHPKVRLCHHRTPGSYSARNAGIAVAQGQIIALTDADCVPDRDWVRNGAEGLARNACRMAGGRIEPSFARAGAPSAIELCDVILHTMNQEQTLRECTSVAGANMWLHRSLFDRLGGFNEALYSAGDCELTQRARQHHEKIVYLADAVVHHRARRSLEELGQRYRRFAGAEFAAKTRAGAGTPVRELRSLSFRYRMGLCLRNIVAGVRSHRGKRNPAVLLSTLLLVEGYLTAVKTVEYARLALGQEAQR